MDALKCLPYPGLHPGTPFRQYQDWQAVNSGKLRDIAESPAKCLHFMQTPQEDTPDFILGRAVHGLILEPEKFDEQYAIAPPCDRRTKEGKQIWGQFCIAAGERTVLTQDDHDRALSMAQSLRCHPLVRQILNWPGQAEVSYCWQDSATKLFCKARADWLCRTPTDLGCCFDLKTAASATPRGFATSIHNYGYHVQAGHYLAGLQALGEEYSAFGFIVVEKSPPYAVAVYQLEPSEVNAGREQAGKLLERYLWCQQNRNWPTYSYDYEKEQYLIHPIQRPIWAQQGE